MSEIFTGGRPDELIADIYDCGYGIKKGVVDPIFTLELLSEIKANDMYNDREVLEGRGPGIHHEPDIRTRLDHMPCLAEYSRELNEAISEVTGLVRDHLTYLTVRVCPVNGMSTRIHRNDDQGGPWLVSLTAAGSGSIKVYADEQLEPGHEIELRGDGWDPEPLTSSEMAAGDVWGLYTKERSVPHAGGMNTSLGPKVLIMLYGWNVRDKYPSKET